HRVFDLGSAQVLEPAPHLHPEIVGLRRQLMNEEKPARVFHSQRFRICEPIGAPHGAASAPSAPVIGLKKCCAAAAAVTAAISGSLKCCRARASGSTGIPPFASL